MVEGHPRRNHCEQWLRNIVLRCTAWVDGIWIIIFLAMSVNHVIPYRYNTFLIFNNFFIDFPYHMALPRDIGKWRPPNWQIRLVAINKKFLFCTLCSRGIISHLTDTPLSFRGIPQYFHRKGILGELTVRCTENINRLGQSKTSKAARHSWSFNKCQCMI